MGGLSLDGGDFWQMAGDHPFFFADQDVLNAVLATGIDPDRVEVLERRLEATVPFTGLRVVDEEALRCAYEDGTEPHVVHHLAPAKPWLEPTIGGVYTQLMLRLLLGPDVAIQVPQRDLPLHLQPGVIAAPGGGTGVPSRAASAACASASGAPAPQRASEVPTPDAAFYAVANSRYFLGAVGMLNSLRLLGHREPAYVLDCGLTPRSGSCWRRTPPWSRRPAMRLRTC